MTKISSQTPIQSTSSTCHKPAALKPEPKKADVSALQTGFDKAKSSSSLLDGAATKAKPQLQRQLPQTPQPSTTQSAQTAAPAAQTAAPAAQTAAPAANEVELGGNAQYQELLQSNSSLQTNQDLINHCYREGGGNWGGAAQVAEGLGMNLNDLVRDRGGALDRGAPSNGTTAPPANGNTTAPPTNGNTTAPPADGNTTAPPVDGNTSAPAGRVDPTTSLDGMSESQKYDHLKSLIEQNGGSFKSGANERNLLSLRTETDADVNGGGGRYDDTTYMLWTDRDGNKRVREYQSNTEPSARYRGRMGVDANGDGRLDQGRLPAGFYEYRTGTSGRLGNVLRPTSSTNAERDTNQDGLFNDNAFGSAGRSMLFHKGGNSITGSAGCQTMTPAEYNRFWNDLHSAGNPGTIGYTLINL